jgi:hypothetical protein
VGRRASLWEPMTKLNPRGRRAWKPLLHGVAAERANRAIDEIARALAAPARDADPPLTGAAARALFFAYLGESRSLDCGATIERHLEQAASQLTTQTMHEGLHLGFTGVAWVSEHILPPAPDEPDGNRAIDEALLALVTRDGAWDGEFELMRGLTGLGIYALERIDQPSGRALVEAIVARLDELAERHEDGIAWLTRPATMSNELREQFPRGVYNLGAAHGAPSVIAMLAAAELSGVTRARPLLDGAMRWLRARTCPDAPSMFPAAIHDGAPSETYRLGWCYGDPGVACALLAAARAVGEATWLDTAVRAARHAARRLLDGDLREAGIECPGLCHGAAGVALLFQRLWNETREPLLGRAALRLYAHALSWYEPHGVDAADDRRWHDDGSLLLGSCGVGLALLAAVSPVEPAWDRLLAASLPPLT